MEDNRRLGVRLRKFGVVLMMSAAIAGVIGIVKPGHERPTPSSNIVKPGHKI